MPVSKSKLARALSAEEMEALCARLATIKGLTGSVLMEIAAELGVSLEKSAAYDFLDKTFEPYLDRMRRRSALARFVQQHTKPEDLTSLADASSGELSQQIFEFLTEAETAGGIDLATKDGVQKAEAFARMIAKLRTGDHRQRALEAQLADREAEKEQGLAAIADLSKAKGLSAEAEATIRSAFNFRTPAKEEAKKA